MKVSDIMSNNPQSVGINEFVTRAREIMRDYDYDSLPVLDNGKVAGIITLQDIINVTSTKSDVTVSGYVRLDIPRLTPDTGLAKAAYVIIHTSEGRAPVIGPGLEARGNAQHQGHLQGPSRDGPRGCAG